MQEEKYHSCLSSFHKIIIDYATIISSASVTDRSLLQQEFPLSLGEFEHIAGPCLNMHGTIVIIIISILAITIMVTASIIKDVFHCVWPPRSWRAYWALVWSGNLQCAMWELLLSGPQDCGNTPCYVTASQLAFYHGRMCYGEKNFQNWSTWLSKRVLRFTSWLYWSTKTSLSSRLRTSKTHSSSADHLCKSTIMMSLHWLMKSNDNNLTTKCSSPFLHYHPLHALPSILSYYLRYHRPPPPHQHHFIIFITTTIMIKAVMKDTNLTFGGEHSHKLSPSCLNVDHVQQSFLPETRIIMMNQGDDSNHNCGDYKTTQICLQLVTTFGLQDN